MKKAIFYVVPLALMVFAFVLVGPISARAVELPSTSVVTICPAGYTCTPIPVQPVGCPAGYICEPTKPSIGGSSSGNSGSGNSSTNSCYVFTTNLTIGSTGADVVALQTWLIANGYDITLISQGRVAKGYFGSATKETLSRYQASVGITENYFGPLTRAKVNVSCNSSSIPVTPNSKPFIGVISPNGGEIWTTGSKRTITWSSNGYTGNVDIRLIEGSEGLGGSYIALNIPNSGSYQWTVPNNLSGQYKVNVSAVGGGTINDTSNELFTITTATAPSSMVSVVSPKQGDVYDSGAQLKLQWTSYNGDFDYYQLMLGNTIANTEVQIDEGYRVSKTQTSFNTFVLWSFVNQITKNSGYSADVIKNSYYVKVNAVKSDKITGGIVNTGKSGIFTITSPTTSVTPTTLTVLTPVNPLTHGDIFSTGETLPLAWSSKSFGVSRIYLLSETGSKVATILATNDNGAFPYTGSTYSWKIPDNIPTGIYKIRVIIGMEGVSGSLEGDSSGTFKIRNLAVATPYITSVSGMAAGNSEIDAGGKVGIQGTNLAGYKDATNVYIGGMPCTINQLSSTLVYCTAPSTLEVGKTYDLYINTTGMGGDKVTSNIVKVKVLSNVTTSTPTPTPTSSPTSVINQSNLNASIWDAINEYYKSDR